MPAVTTRGLAGAFAIPVLALGLTACSSTSGPGSDPDGSAALTAEQVVLASYEGLEGGSYTMDMTITVNGSDFITSTTVIDGEASHVSQDVHMSAILEAMGDGDFDDPELAGLLESMFTDVHSETIVVDGVVYMQVSGGALDVSSSFDPDAWFTADLSGMVDLNAIYEQIGGLDLASQTKLLFSELTNLEQTGDGVYTGTLKADSQVAKSMVGTTSAMGDPAAEGGFDATETTVVVTVDGEGLLRGIEVSVPELDGVAVRMVGEIVQVGGEVDITAPDSDNLHTFDELFGTTG